MTAERVLTKRGKTSIDEPLSAGALALWRKHRMRGCTSCSFHASALNVCLFGNGDLPTKGMVVGDAPTAADDEAMRPMAGLAGQFLREALREVDVDLASLYTTYLIKCPIPRDKTDPQLKASLEACGGYLLREIEEVSPRVILSLGAHPYKFFTHKLGITKNRGQMISWEGVGMPIDVVPTLSPAYVLTNPNYYGVFQADLAKFARRLRGEDQTPGVNLIPVDTREKLADMLAELAEDTAPLTFDTETRGFVDYRPGFSRVWMVALTRGRRDPDGNLRVFAVPLEHPESPFLVEEDPWRAAAPHLRDLTRPADPDVVAAVVGLIRGSRVNGHNVKFDLRQIEQLARRYGI